MAGSNCLLAAALAAAVALLATDKVEASGILADTPTRLITLGASGMQFGGCSIAFDGSSYWAGKVGSGSGITLSQWDMAGTLVGSFANGVDHRSLFTDPSGTVYATDYGGGGIAVFRYTGSSKTLMYILSTTPDSQMEFGYRPSDGNLYGHSQGVIYSYNFVTGVANGSFPLIGYSASGSYPANAQIAVVNDPAYGEVILTYDQFGVIEAWDFGGSNLGSCTVGLSSFDQTFSFGFSDGKFWIEDAAGGTWGGYDIGLSAGSLSGDVSSISLSAGGNQALVMNLGAAAGLKSYQILGSVTGDAPGFAYTGTAIPLNPDAYTIFTLLSPNTPPLLNSAGVLDINGQATAIFTLPAGTDPSLVGLSVYHAGLTIELVSGFLVVSEATTSVSVALVP